MAAPYFWLILIHWKAHQNRKGFRVLSWNFSYKFHVILHFFARKFESWKILSNEIHTDREFEELSTIEKKLIFSIFFLNLERKFCDKHYCIYLRKYSFQWKFTYIVAMKLRKPILNENRSKNSFFWSTNFMDYNLASFSPENMEAEKSCRMRYLQIEEWKNCPQSKNNSF